MLLLIKSAFNMIVAVLSAAALGIVVSYVRTTYDLQVESSPKAMVNLHEVLLPPLVNLQLFVFLFDAVVALYYIYHWPMWDKIKKNFVYYQYEAQPLERQDMSSLLLSTVFVVMTKVNFMILI